MFEKSIKEELLDGLFIYHVQNFLSYNENTIGTKTLQILIQFVEIFRQNSWI